MCESVCSLRLWPEDLYFYVPGRLAAPFFSFISPSIPPEAAAICILRHTTVPPCFSSSLSLFLTWQALHRWSRFFMFFNCLSWRRLLRKLCALQTINWIDSVVSRCSKFTQMSDTCCKSGEVFSRKFGWAETALNVRVKDSWQKWNMKKIKVEQEKRAVKIPNLKGTGKKSSWNEARLGSVELKRRHLLQLTCQREMQKRSRVWEI